ncbi:MAG: DNA cytosine methyltransferase [Alphaproteobacteria bacterium]
MKVAGLFAGIGGFEKGLVESGHEAEMLCEIWEPARAVLSARFPSTPAANDVVSLRSLPGNVELVTAGFPCQDLSQAGMTAGIEGSRSSLVGHVFRLLDERKVPWIVLENVSFMLHLARGKALHSLIDELESRGYRWAYRVVNSLAFVPQRRERVLLVATTTDVDPAAVLLTDEAEPKLAATDLSASANGFYWTEGIRGLGWASDSIPTLKNGSTVGIASPPAIMLPSGRVIMPDIRDAERLQGFPEDWTEPAGTVGRATLRWSLVGNAVTVPVARWIGERLAYPGIYVSARDRNLPANGKWPRAARYDGERRRAVEIGAFPHWFERPSLASFLRYPGKKLSARATRGFLNRMGRGTLRFPPGFRERIAAHLLAMESDEDLRSATVPELLAAE